MNAMQAVLELLEIAANDYATHQTRKAQLRLIMEFAKRHAESEKPEPVRVTPNGTLEVDDIPF